IKIGNQYYIFKSLETYPNSDMQTWLVTFSSAEKPFEIFLYQRKEKLATFLRESHSELKSFKLSRQVGFDFVARDGLTIQAYVNLPPNEPLQSAADVSAELRDLAELGMIPVNRQRMVLLVHGGPASRDHYGFLNTVAALTSRGYAVLRVNFRGSVYFGKRLYNAGIGEWSRKMHDDLIDAVEFTIENGIANRSQVAIMGTSYGGYAALVGLTFTPDTFACGVDINGPSNLITQMEALPPYWHGLRRRFFKVMGGDTETEEGRRELIARSPFFLADRVKKPLLIMQGANDARVKQKESEQFVDALKNHSIPVTFVLFNDEGHIFRHRPNRLAEYGHFEKFLHECLGGEYEPFISGQYNENAIVHTSGLITKNDGISESSGGGE
ncbi:hypothetical protein PMAYCL1PPCAC_31048, partial [Pristionchus mayeri]